MLGMKGNNEELSTKFELKYIRSQNHPYCEHWRSLVPNGPGVVRHEKFNRKNPEEDGRDKVDVWINIRGYKYLKS